MAPHRIQKPLGGLRVRALTGVGWRAAILRRTPTVLIDYLVEILFAFVAIISGVGQLTGFSTNSVSRSLPEGLAQTYGVVLVVGGATVGFALIARKFGTILPSGMRLLASAVTVYAGVLIGYVGWRDALQPIVMSLVVGVILGWRAFLLRSAFVLIEASSRKPPATDERRP